VKKKTKKLLALCELNFILAGMARTLHPISPDICIRNKNLKLKREIVSIAKSTGLTLSQFCRRELMKIAASYPDAAKNYRDDDDCC
jgi:hypothetical protein